MAPLLTLTPLVVTFTDRRDTIMVVHSEKSTAAACVEARFLLDGAEHLQLVPTSADGSLHFGATIHVVAATRSRKRYLAGQAFRQFLVWSGSQPSAKAAFRLVSPTGSTGEVEAGAAFLLQSFQWPQYFVHFRRAAHGREVGALVLRRHAKEAVQFSAVDALERASDLLRLRVNSGRSAIPTVFVSAVSFDVDLLATEAPIEDALPVLDHTFSCATFYAASDDDAIADVPVAYRADWRLSSCQSP
ncbi:hypothetical protein ACHHYP_10519 [Achlya hypogyna]|uniref:Uncharacterized protein n=1 Tax=Achlya hypogyna TaxID=1202772 RepID=A0A1V9YLB2_ACHHY|nr:hypothetical protein ACHHYP_10519 [Achlya hypogyna]